MKLKRLTDEGFAQLAKHTRLRDKALAIARAILVEGEPVPAVCRENGVTSSRAYSILERIEKAYLTSDVVPRDALVEVTMMLPQGVSRELERYSAAIVGTDNAGERARTADQLAASIRAVTQQIQH
ncbi:TrfB-related DNA-binding protein [Achromobacter ruhlandii]|uniref:TrfB-related DNA-binding protein n=1 Tax=Achromobacter ruhlandii TaxID=72557 RepID=UPI003BA2F2A2